MAPAGYTLSVKNRLAVITLSRPEKKNALNPELYAAITRTLNELSIRDDVAITAITGAGDYYSSGNDLMAAFESLGSSDIEATISNSVETVRCVSNQLKFI